MKHFKLNLPSFIVVLGALMVLAGCSGSAPVVDKKPDTPVDVDKSSTEKTTEAKSTEPTEEPPKVVDLPNDLKHDAFDYYGIGLSEPIDMEVTSNTQTAVVTGSQTTTLKEIKDGKAVFLVERTGGLSTLGTNELTLEKDGIYVKSSSIAKVGERELEMPAGLQPGKTWSTTTELSSDSRSMKVKSTFVVKAIEKVTTKKATYDNALLIVSTGKGTQDGSNVSITTKSWFVRGRGNVKAVIVRTPGTGKPETLTIQETK
ncbi:MAG: hypothetical protein ACOYON_12160 [Fimbriimonas sp.]